MPTLAAQAPEEIGDGTEPSTYPCIGRRTVKRRVLADAIQLEVVSLRNGAGFAVAQTTDDKHERYLINNDTVIEDGLALRVNQRITACVTAGHFVVRASPVRALPREC